MGWTLALAILLMAQRRPMVPENAVFKNVVDLSHTVSESAPNWDGEPKSVSAHVTGTHEKDGFYTRRLSLDEHSSTHLDAPAHTLNGMWTVDQIPAERLVRPLVILDVSKNAQENSDYLISVEDIAAWEAKHGEMPYGAVVIAYTGWSVRWNSSREYRNQDAEGVLHFPGYSLEAARFLVEARQIVGLGIDTLSVDRGVSTDFQVHKYCAERSVYHLENVANLMQAPQSGALVVVTPMKIERGSGAPTRILALVK
jgi:kynurenine formamidase